MLTRPALGVCRSKANNLLHRLGHRFRGERAGPAIGLEREPSAAAKQWKQWLSEQGLSATQVANVEAVLNKQGMPAETWLGTLKGIPHYELQGLALGDGADTPEPMMEDDDGAMTRTATPALPPAGMAGGGWPPADSIPARGSETEELATVKTKVNLY